MRVTQLLTSDVILGRTKNRRLTKVESSKSTRRKVSIIPKIIKEFLSQNNLMIVKGLHKIGLRIDD